MYMYMYSENRVCDAESCNVSRRLTFSSPQNMRWCDVRFVAGTGYLVRIDRRFGTAPNPRVSSYVDDHVQSFHH